MRHNKRFDFIFGLLAVTIVLLSFGAGREVIACAGGGGGPGSCPSCQHWSVDSCVNDENGTDCGDCKECSGGTCGTTCSGCESCESDACVDDDENCGDCEECSGGTCGTTCTGCESCESDACVDDDENCEDCDECTGGTCGTSCTGCETCEGETCVDDDENCEDCDECTGGTCGTTCTGCETCEGETCVDDDENCDDCEECAGGTCGTTCTGCESCESDACVDDDGNCSGCQDCVSASCTDNDGNCAGDCEECTGGTCGTSCTGCESCDEDVCTNDDSECDEDDCEECNNGACGSICTGGQCCDGSGSCETPADWGAATISGTFSAPPNLVQNIENAVNNIPNVNINLTEVKGAFTGQAKDCCNDGLLDEDGERCKEATLTLSAEIDGVTIWGLPTISYEFDFIGLAKIDIDFEAGVQLAADFSITGKLGKRWEDCVPEDCLYGEITGGATILCGLTCDAIICQDTIWTSPSCVEVAITPAALSVSFTGNVGYNSKDSCSAGLTGGLTLGQVKFISEFKVSGVGVNYEYVIYSGS